MSVEAGQQQDGQEATFSNTPDVPRPVPPAAQESADAQIGRNHPDFVRNNMDPADPNNYGERSGLPRFSEDKAREVAHAPGVVETEEESVRAAKRLAAEQAAGSPAVWVDRADTDAVDARYARNEAVRDADMAYERDQKQNQ